MVDTINKSNTTKKTPVKKTVAVKASTKKASVKKTVAVKTSTKKASVKKTVAVKTSTIKAPVKKTVAVKTSTTKAPVKKTVAVKTSTSKTPVKKTVTVKTSTVKVPVKKAVSRKSTVPKTNSDSESSKSDCGFIKKNFLDISLLYKNIVHWNVSKLVIFIWSIILGFISVSPFILLFFVYSLYSDVSIGMLINGMFNGTLLSNLFGNIVLIGIVVVYVIVFSYSNFLLIKVNNSYQSGKKLGFKDNDYFNISKIVKFFNLSFLNLFILSLPVLLFFMLMGILYMFSGGFESVSVLLYSMEINYFVVLSFSFFVICSILVFYLYYRIVFSYLVMGDDKYYDKSKSALNYVKESFRKTKNIKNFFKFLLMVILIVIITLPIKYVGKVLEMNDNDFTKYFEYISTSDDGRAYLNSVDSVRYKGLEVQYKGLKKEEIIVRMDKNNLYLVLFTIFNFIFLYGLFIMVLSSFYKRELN